MQIALALYPNFTMLDIIGPFQVLADVPATRSCSPPKRDPWSTTPDTGGTP